MTETATSTTFDDWDAVAPADDAAASTDDTVSIDEFFDILDEAVAEDGAGDASSSVAWEMIWTSDWCYYTITDGLASEVECIEEPAQDADDQAWDDEDENDEGFRLPEIEFTTGDEAEIE